MRNLAQETFNLFSHASVTNNSLDSTYYQLALEITIARSVSSDVMIDWRDSAENGWSVPSA